MVAVQKIVVDQVVVLLVLLDHFLLLLCSVVSRGKTQEEERDDRATPHQMLSSPGVTDGVPSSSDTWCNRNHQHQERTGSPTFGCIVYDEYVVFWIGHVVQ